ncbi:MAG TPA: hypothetical protein VK358_11715, partial [Longimicrobium sp.]|nr:hypothetical protein [Longimicrobium sp.]
MSSPASDPPGQLLVVWSGGSPGGPLCSFTYDIPAYFVSPPAPVPVQPAQVGGLYSVNGPSALYVDSQFYVFYRGGGTQDGDVCYTALQNPAGGAIPGAQTQDAPVVAWLPGSNSTFVAFNGYKYGTTNDQELYSTILGALNGSPPSTPVAGLGGAFNGYFSPGVAATPDGAVSIFWKGVAGDDQLYYAVNPGPGSGGFVNNVPVNFNGAVPTASGRPSLAAWVPSASDGGGDVLLAVYPSDGQLWYMEAAYAAGNASWQTQAPVPVDTILAKAGPSGGPV